jgi:hypothetical protein
MHSPDGGVVEGTTDSVDTVMRLLGQWWWVIAVVVGCLLAVRFAGRRGTAGSTSAGSGCLIALVFTVLFVLFVIL